MWTSLTEYHRPPTMDMAVRLLSRDSPRTVALAGGSWLVARRDSAVEAVVDLGSLNLAYVRANQQRLQIGAMTTLQDLTADSQIHDFSGGLLAQAARQMGPVARRNVATIGGTLVVGGSTNLVALSLLALETEVVLHDPNPRTISMGELLARSLERGALITEIVVNALPSDSGVALESVGATPRAVSVVNAVAVATRRGEQWQAARLALDGVAPYPVRLPSIESGLINETASGDLWQRLAQDVSQTIDPTGDVHASAVYRREVAGLVAARALRKAWEQAGQQAAR